jgi:hypothetical protein
MGWLCAGPHKFKTQRLSPGRVNSYSVHFRFSQHFDFPPEKAYRWCTDYAPEDIKLQGKEGVRKIRWVNEDTVLLTDVTSSGGKRVEKRKLVRLYPERLSWTNTRVGSEGRHSQFLYEVSAEKGGSRLDFTGSQVFLGKRPSNAKVAAIAGDLTKEDSETWQNLAKAMAKDLGAPSRNR